MILVSITCLTYNHAPYLRECLDSLLAQKVKFNYEILLHDDASTDGTIEIIREYQKNYPDKLKPIIQAENQFSRGFRSVNVKYNFSRAAGKYIAFCEGDDYWTDPMKLQRQVDLLESRPDLSISAENSLVITDDGKKYPFGIKPTRIVETSEIIRSRQFHTASLVIRNFEGLSSISNNFPAGDTTLVLRLAQRGKIHYNDHLSSIYRRGAQGITAKFNDPVIIKGLVQAYELQDELTFHQHSRMLQKKIRQLGNKPAKQFGDFLLRGSAKALGIKRLNYFDIENDNVIKKFWLLLTRKIRILPD